MSLTSGFARLLLLTGHAAETRNNPHAAGLDCGACCGQSGEVNARAVAALLNEPEVRLDLAGRGIALPSDTHVLPGLHNTTTDEVRLFDLDEVPASHQADVDALIAQLRAAGQRARQERAPRLGIREDDDAVRLAALQQRARGWASVRPEWGLAGNAGFVVARRSAIRHLNLAGRAFLHEYRHEQDAGYRVLEGILTAPMLVAHWINLQYYASTVDNRHLGSGDKTLHNVVGGHIGVFEGNGGDLRIGLPLQCVHDGTAWVHAPLRLSVFVEAPAAAVQGIVARHQVVRSLLDNGWLTLTCLDLEQGSASAYRGGETPWEVTALA